MTQTYGNLLECPRDGKAILERVYWALFRMPVPYVPRGTFGDVEVVNWAAAETVCKLIREHAQEEKV